MTFCFTWCMSKCVTTCNVLKHSCSNRAVQGRCATWYGRTHASQKNPDCRGIWGRAPFATVSQASEQCPAHEEKEEEENEIYIFSRFIVWNKDSDLKPSTVFKTGRE